MSVYNLQNNNFVALNETSGILQNMTSSNVEYVVCADGETPVNNTGIRINPSKKLKFCQTVGTSYVRVVGNTKGDVIVTPNECSSGGGGGTNTVVFNHIKDWSPNTQYSTGTLVIKDTKLYKCVNPNNRETFVASDWVEIGGGSGSGISSWASDTVYNPNDIVLRGNTLYVCIDGHTSSEDFDEDNEYWMIITDDVGTILPDWKPREKYEKDEIVNVGGFIYRCKREHISLNTFANAVGVTGDEGDWELISWVDWDTDTQYIEGQVVYSGGALYKCIANHISDSTSITNDMAEGYEKWVKISGYELPTASSSVKGGIKVGNTLEINAQSGALNIKKATKTQLGGIKVGDGLEIKSDGTLSVSTSVGKDIVPWTANTSYKAGQYVIYNNNLYECKTTNKDATFDEKKWQLIGGSSESVVIRDWENGESYVPGDLVIYNNVLYKCDTTNDDETFDSEKWISIGKTDASLREWKSGTSYKVGNFVVKNNKLYKCATANSDTTFDSTKWTEIGDMSNIKAWERGTSYAEDDYVIYNNRVYQCTTANDDDTFDSTKWTDIGAIQSIVEEWQSGKDYSVGALVIKDKVIYKCTEANDDTTFDSTKWEVQIDNSNAVTVWSSGTSYKAGNYVVYEGKIYKCKTTNSDVAFDAEKWEAVGSPSGSYLEPWETKKTYKKNQLVEYKNDVYMCLVGHTSNIFNTDYNNEVWLKVDHSVPDFMKQKLYVKDSVVVYDGKQYRCLQTHTSNADNPLESVAETFTRSYTWSNPSAINYVCRTGSGGGDAYDAVKTVTYDMGADYEITRIVLGFKNSALYIRAFNVQASVDGTNWTTLKSYSFNSAQTGVDFTVDKEIARYIKITATGRSSFTGTNDGQTILSSVAIYRGIGNWWEELSGGAGVVTWEMNKHYAPNVLTVQDGKLYVCVQDHTSGTYFDADRLDGKWQVLCGGSGNGSVNNPLGTIISYMGTTPPANYLACDGTVYDIDDYQELADFINAQFGSYDFFGGNGTTTFAVPDLRGEFLRGTGTNSHSNQGSGANAGVHQDATEIPLAAMHSDNKMGFFFDATSTWHYGAKNTDTMGIGSTSRVEGTPFSPIGATESLGAYFSSRPTNTSVLYCIRYNSPTSSTNYSTTEQRIGTWIDGKPLYQKSYSGTLADTTLSTIDASLGEIIDWIVDGSVIVKLTRDSSYWLIPNGFYDTTQFISKPFKTVENEIVIKTSDGYNSLPYKATIQYTKTTD